MKTYNGKYPVVTFKVDYSKLIAEAADRYAYNTAAVKAAAWPTGRPKPAYKAAIKKYHSNHKFTAASIAGASCDVYVCTTVRGSGADPEYPQGLWRQRRYVKGAGKAKWDVLPASQGKTGDLFHYKKAIPGRHGHTGVIVNGKVKEASAKHYYGRTTDTLKARLSKKGKVYVEVYRRKPGTVYKPIKKGMTGKQVERLQAYINWLYGRQVLRVDGIFGPITHKWVLKMQGKLKTTQDGIVGKDTVRKMKGYQK